MKELNEKDAALLVELWNLFTTWSSQPGNDMAYLRLYDDQSGHFCWGKGENRPVREWGDWAEAIELFQMICQLNRQQTEAWITRERGEENTSHE